MRRDLHLLHPLGVAWMAEPFDCYGRNPLPRWGNRWENQPVRDFDDADGAGPENIFLFEPEDTHALAGTYRIGVHYRRAEDAATGEAWGPSEATVRVYFDGAQVAEWTRLLQSTADFWEVAAIIWTDVDRRVLEINRYHQGVP